MSLTAEQSRGLEVAKYLAEKGVPLFLAHPDPSKLGFKLPNNWQNTVPDPGVVARWKPKLALCAVMGHVLDAIDIDPRNGGSEKELDLALGRQMPKVYARQKTPSGGIHMFIATLGVRSLDGLLPGVDVKAGDATGQGRGFVFIAPTARVSKATGQVAEYEWDIA